MLTMIITHLDTVYTFTGFYVTMISVAFIIVFFTALRLFFSLRLEKAVFILDSRLNQSTENDIFQISEIIIQKDRIVSEMKEKVSIYKAFFENSSDAFLVIDNGIIIDCNDEALQIFGCRTREQLILKSPVAFSPECQPDGKKSPESYENFSFSSEKNSKNFKWIHCKSDDTNYYADVVLSTMDANDRVLQQAIIRNISSDIISEQELQNANESAEQANSAKSEFNMSHAFSSNARILLVEDTLTNQRIMINHIKKAGINVDLAVNGKDGVEAFKKCSYDLVIMDIQMGVMDGYDATKEIRKYENNGIRTPIIAISANAVKDDIKKCFKAGVDDYASKPVKKKTLYELIQKWIPKKRLQTASFSTGSQVAPELNDAPLNYPKALAEFGDDKELLDEVLQEFIHKVDSQILEISTALKSNNALVIQNQAHSIRGGAANLIAPSLTQAAAELENLGKNKALEKGAEVLENLKKEFNKLKRFKTNFYES